MLTAFIVRGTRLYFLYTHKTFRELALISSFSRLLVISLKMFYYLNCTSNEYYCMEFGAVYKLR